MSGLRFDPNAACDECGKFGAYAFEGEALCLECYEGRGSCCAERTMCVDFEALDRAQNESAQPPKG